jgi:WD40 repeat protein
LLQTITTDFSPNPESMTQCVVWSRDNNGLVVAGDDRVVRIFKVKAPNDFKSDLDMTLELKTDHFDSINSIDISPNKTLLVTAGNDC